MPQTAAEDTQLALAGLPDQESLVGIFIAQSGAIATVDQGTSRLTVKTAVTGGILPGDAVRLERRDGQLIMLGPTAPRPRSGRVTNAGNPARIEYPPGSGTTALMPVNPAYTPAVDDLVLLDWSTNGFVICKTGSVAPPAPPAPPPAAASETRTEKFTALDSGSFQGYWRINDVWSSANNYSAWFYGSKIRDTIPDGARIDRAQIYLPLEKLVGPAPLGRHDQDHKPGGGLAITNTVNLGTDQRNGLVDIPTSLLEHLKANPGGIGFGYGGYNIWRGTQRDGDSGALIVTFTT